MVLTLDSLTRDIHQSIIHIKHGFDFRFHTQFLLLHHTCGMGTCPSLLMSTPPPFTSQSPPRGSIRKAQEPSSPDARLTGALTMPVRPPSCLEARNMARKIPKFLSSQTQSHPRRCSAFQWLREPRIICCGGHCWEFGWPGQRNAQLFVCRISGKQDRVHLCLHQ